MTNKWESSLDRQRMLKRQGIALLYERIKLLIEVYEDAAFRKWCEDSSVIDLDYLDAELSDVAVSFMTLRAVFIQHPNVDDWQGGNIRQMIADVIELQKVGRERVNVISWKERCLAAEKEVERLRFELQKRDSTIAELRSCLTVVASDGQRGAA